MNNVDNATLTKVLAGLREDLVQGFNTWNAEKKDRYIQKAIGKVDVLLMIVRDGNCK